MGFVTREELLGAFLPIVCYWVYATMMDMMPERYRLYTKQQEKKLTRDYLSKAHVIKNVLNAQAVQISITLTLFYLTGPVQIREQPPMYKQMLQWLVAMLVTDTWIYFTHRLLHTRYLYRRLHAIHHEVMVPYAIGTLYQHPIEGVLLNSAAGAVAYAVSGMTPTTALFYFCMATVKNVDDHCGYTLPWSPFRIFGDSVRFHDFHHSIQGHKWNYGNPWLTFWDRVMGTYKDPTTYYENLKPSLKEM